METGSPAGNSLALGCFLTIEFTLPLRECIASCVSLTNWNYHSVFSSLKSFKVKLANCCCKRGNTSVEQGKITSSKSLHYRSFFNKRLLLEVGGFHELQTELLTCFHFWGSDCLYPCGQLDHCEEGTEIMNFLKLSLLSLSLSLSFFHSLQFLLKQIQKQKQLHLPIPLRMIKEMVQKLDY